jgi:GDSL-like Lipase/Acylhydrolase family
MDTRMIFMGIICCGVFAATLTYAAAAKPKTASNPESGSKAETKKVKESWETTPDPSLPNVLIIGDSISIGYFFEVRKQLAGKANVFRPIKDAKSPENCSGTLHGVQNIDRWLKGQKWDVIHFNFGLHDLKHVSKDDPSKPSSNPEDPVQASLEVYTKNMEEIVKKLKATGATLIYATTTPVVPGCTSPLREPESPGKYNEAALKIMTQNKIAVNDLYTFCLPQLDKIQLPKNVHFKDEGSTLLAKEVAQKITDALAKPSK